MEKDALRESLVMCIGCVRENHEKARCALEPVEDEYVKEHEQKEAKD